MRCGFQGSTDGLLSLSLLLFSLLFNFFLCSCPQRSWDRHPKQLRAFVQLPQSWSGSINFDFKAGPPPNMTSLRLLAWKHLCKKSRNCAQGPHCAEAENPRLEKINESLLYSTPREHSFVRLILQGSFFGNLSWEFAVTDSLFVLKALKSKKNLETLITA